MERLTSPNINVDPDTDRFLHAAIGGKEIDWKQCRDSTLNVLINGPTSNGFGKDIFRKMARDLYGRLKAYEDTGMYPESVEALKLSMMGKAISEITEFNGLPIDRLRELAEADKDGRCVVLPCKVGDTAYYRNGPFIIDFEVIGYQVDERGAWCFQGEHFDEETEKTYYCDPSTDKIGQTVFLTRDEAERAMEGRKESDHA